MRKYASILLLLSSVNAFAQSSAQIEANKGVLKLSPTALLPNPCRQGQLWFDTDLTAVKSCNDGLTWSLIGSGGSSRTALTANTTFYVRTDGSDSNTCLGDTAGTACLTIQGAVNKVLFNYDVAGYTPTIQVAAGTYAETVIIGHPLYSSTNVVPYLYVIGAGDTTIVNSLNCENFRTYCSFQSMKLATDGSLTINYGATGDAGLLTFSTTGSVNVQTNSNLLISDDMYFTGGNPYYCSSNSYLYINAPTHLSNGADFTYLFQADGNSTIYINDDVWYDTNIVVNNSVFYADNNSIINTYNYITSGTGTITGAGYAAEAHGGSKLIFYDPSSYWPPWTTTKTVYLAGAEYAIQAPDPNVTSCGTDPTISGNDFAGLITAGTGTVTSCTLTLQITLDTDPVCVVQNTTTTQLMGVSVSGAVVTITGADFNGDAISYICRPRT